MNTKLTTIMFLGIIGLGLGVKNAAASDLSRLLEHSRINVAYGSGYPNYYGGYAPQYGPQYAPPYPQYAPQYGGYSQQPGGYFQAQPGYYPPAPAPFLNAPIGFGFGYDGAIPRPKWQGGDNCHHGDRHGHHHHFGGWDRDD